MAKFRVRFSRSYTITEGFDRIIEAPSLNELQAAVNSLAGDFNMDSPDDCSEIEGDSDVGDYCAEIISAEVHKASTPDYVVQQDGQCIPYEA